MTRSVNLARTHEKGKAMTDECRTEVWVDNAGGIYLYQGAIGGVIGVNIRYACALRGVEGAEEVAGMFHQIEDGTDPLEEGWEYGGYESLDQAQDDYSRFCWTGEIGFKLMAASYFGKGTEALVCRDPEQDPEYTARVFSRKLIELAGKEE